MKRPDYVHCVVVNMVKKDAFNDTWCGRKVGSMEWLFQSVDHAAINGKNEGRLVACKECTAKIYKSLQNGDDY